MLEVLPLDQYFEIERLMQAFSIKQLQTTVTAATWMGHNGIDFPLLIAYLKMHPSMLELSQIGYFHPQPSVEHSLRIKKYERSLPKKLRSSLRRERLKRSPGGLVTARG